MVYAQIPQLLLLWVSMTKNNVTSLYNSENYRAMVISSTMKLAVWCPLS